MSLRRISAEVDTIPSGVAKKYVREYLVDGYEMGFGRAGKYQSHSHLFFVDVLFSPRGIRWSNAASESIETQLLVVPPRTLIPNLETGGFFFLKFSPDPAEVKLPDKVDRALSEGCLSHYSRSAALVFPWYSRAERREQEIRIELSNHMLTISFMSHENIVIGE